MLVYKKVENPELVRYIDSNFAGCTYDKRSMSGYLFSLGGVAISWRNEQV